MLTHKSGFMRLRETVRECVVSLVMLIYTGMGGQNFSHVSPRYHVILSESCKFVIPSINEMNIVWDQHSAYDGCEFTKADLRAVAWGKTLDSGGGGNAAG